MKKSIQNLKVIGTNLLLGSMITLSMTGCCDTSNISLGYTDVSYDAESGKVMGSLSYEEVSQNVKVVTLEGENGKHFQELMYVQEHSRDFPLSKQFAFQYRTSYIRLEDGWEMASYDYVGEEEQKNKDPIRSYGVFTVVSEEEFLSYLLEHLDRKEQYDVDDILAVYQEKLASESEKSSKEVKVYG